MSHMSEEDKQFVREIREAGVLQDVKDHLLDQSEGVIMIACSDGDQMSDVFSFQEEMSENQRPKPRVHTLALNGGGLLLPETSPLNKPGREDVILLKHLKQAIELKGITTVALYVHAPCGAAGLCNLSMAEMIDLLISAKALIKSEISEVTVACFVHVNKGEGNKRTYFASREKWEEWKAARENAA